MQVDDSSLLNKHLPTRASGFWLNEVKKPEYQLWSQTASQEINAIDARLAQVEREARDLASRKHWLEGLYLVKSGLADLRSRRVTPNGSVISLIVYRYDSSSPTGVVSCASAPDDEAHRAEAAQLGITVHSSHY